MAVQQQITRQKILHDWVKLSAANHLQLKFGDTENNSSQPQKN